MPSIKPADLPRVGGLLPAVHVDPLVTTTVSALPTVPQSGVIYEYTNTAAPLVIPGYLGRRSTKLNAPGFFAWDGRGFYQVEQITLKNVSKPGLGDLVKPKPPVIDPDADPETPAEIASAPTEDIILREAQKILTDYTGLLRGQATLSQR